MQFAGGHFRADGDALLERDRPGIEGFFHPHHRDAGFAVARHDGALDRRRAPPARQQRGVQVEAPLGRRVENGFRQDQAIGDDDRDVGLVAGKERRRFGCTQARRSEDGKT